MDSNTLKTILDSQDQAYRSALELCMKQVNEDLRFYKSSVDDLKRSLEYTQAEVHELKSEVNQLERVRKEDKSIIANLTDQLTKSRSALGDLEDRANYQEDYNRRNNLHITGIEEQQGETWEQTAVQVKKIIENKLQLPGIELERANRVGPRRESGPRPVVVRFLRFPDRQAVMRNVTKLRGSRIYINEDLCPASQAIKREKLPLLKQARNDGKIAYFSHTKLVIKDRLAREEVGDSRTANGARMDGADGPPGADPSRPSGAGSSGGATGWATGSTSAAALLETETVAVDEATRASPAMAQNKKKTRSSRK